MLDTIKTTYWSFIPRRGSGGPPTRTDPPRPLRPELVAGAIERARDGARLSADELTALFAETRPQAIEEIRLAADELRAELAGETVTFVVNRNINVSNVCTVGCAFCGFGQSRRSPDAYQHSVQEFARRVREAVAYGASELCIQSGIHPDWTLQDYLDWLELAKRTAQGEGVDIHLHAYSPMEIAHMCDISGLPPSEVFARLRDAGLGSTPGTAAEVLHDGVRERISPNKLPVARWVEIIEASHAAGLRSTATVMFGHIEEPWELAEHMRVVRELQERTGGITEFVPLSFIPFQTLLGRTHGVEEISRGREPQAHRRLSPCAGTDGSEPAGVVGEDGPRRRARVAALGRQRSRRHADGGVDQPARRQLPRHEARPRAADRGRSRSRAGPRPNAPRCTRSGAAFRCRRQRQLEPPPASSRLRKPLPEQVLLERAKQRRRAGAVAGRDEPLEAFDHHDGLARVLRAREVRGGRGGVCDGQPGGAQCEAARRPCARASHPAASCRRSRAPRRTAHGARPVRSCR